jgi:hypothetical protein
VITSKSASAEAFADRVSLERMPMSSSNLAKTQMRVRTPTLALHTQCRVPRRMEPAVESVSELRDPPMLLGTLGSSGGPGPTAAML